MFLIASRHENGKSYWNSERQRFGARTVATRYNTQKEAEDATCEIQSLYTEIGFRAASKYGPPQIEEE